MDISSMLSSPTTVQKKSPLLNMQAQSQQGLKKNKFFEQAIKIAFSDASPEEKKMMFKNLKLEMEAEGMKDQLEEIEKLQKRIKEKAEEAKQDEGALEEINEQGDMMVISKRAREELEKSASQPETGSATGGSATGGHNSAGGSVQSSSME